MMDRRRIKESNIYVYPKSAGDRRTRAKNAGKGAVRGGGEIYKELTSQGRRFCAAAGLLEEIAVMFLFGIRIEAAPAAVLFFLWFLFAVLTAAALIGADNICDSLRTSYRRYRRALAAAQQAAYAKGADAL